MQNKNTREEVFVALSDERDNQVYKWRDLDDRNSVADFLCYMQRYLNNAVIYNNPDMPGASLLSVKKLAALGVACMEKFGVAN